MTCSTWASFQVLHLTDLIVTYITNIFKNLQTLYRDIQKTMSLDKSTQNWLVVSTHLKNISQIGSFPQVGMKIKNIWNHHLEKQRENHERENREAKMPLSRAFCGSTPNLDKAFTAFGFRNKDRNSLGVSE